MDAEPSDTSSDCFGRSRRSSVPLAASSSSKVRSGTSFVVDPCERHRMTRRYSPASRTTHHYGRAMGNRERGQFALLCAATLFEFTALGVYMSALPLFVTDELGGS